jgi:hypothetical protein
LPFSAISVEIYYIFATVWGREQYTLYGVLLLVFFIVLSVSACISIALTYFQVEEQIPEAKTHFVFSYRQRITAGGGGAFSPREALASLSFSTRVFTTCAVQICPALLKL